ncbi:MAG: Gfo/Idh/MocA family oxidoreductase [Candidatus Dormiibacterota bacterium]
MIAAPLRWGVLGAADIANKAVIPAILAAGGQMVALASRDLERGGEIAAKFAIPQLCPSYEALLEADLDAVYIPLPNSLHRPWTLRAVAAGKHVLCEKPMALTAAEAREMGEAAADHGVVLAEAVMYRYHPRWHVIRELVGQGSLGGLRHIQGAFTFPLRQESDIRWDPALGGGALYDVGSYLVNASRWLVGEPTRVLTRAQLRHGVVSDGSMLLEFKTPQGAVSAELAYSFESAEHQRLELIGTEASLTIPKPFTAWHEEAIPLWLSPAPGGTSRRVPTPAADPYREMVSAFTVRVGGGALLPTEADDAELGLRVLDAGHRSHVSGKWETPWAAASPIP